MPLITISVWNKWKTMKILMHINYISANNWSTMQNMFQKQSNSVVIHKLLLHL